MSRSVRDLRELICISRLSYHGEGEENPDFQDTNSTGDDLNGNHVPKETTTQPKKKSSSQKKPQDRVLSGLKGTDGCVTPPPSSGSSGKGSPLPPIRKSSAGSSGSSSPGSSGRSSPLLTNDLHPLRPISSIARKYKAQKTNFDDVLVFMDATVVGEWLTRANQSVKSLTTWLHTDCNFVHFAHFWLTEISNSKQRESVDVEFSIIMDEVQFAFGVGLEGKDISQEHLNELMSAVFWEYPRKFSDSDSKYFFLTMIVCLCSGRQDNYKALLSNVRCATNNKQFAQLILAMRSFTLVSICAGVIEFYKKVATVKLSEPTSEASLHGRDLTTVAKNFAFQAVEKGFVNVFQFFVQEYQLDHVSTTSEVGKTFLFSAVLSGKKEMLLYLLSLEPKVDVNQIAPASGNTPVHAAVNCNDCQMVRLLVEAGADLNTTNAECEGATPLHLAIMSGNTEMVSLLVSLGCSCNAYMGAMAVTPQDLAKELDLEEIVELLEKAQIK